VLRSAVESTEIFLGMFIGTFSWEYNVRRLQQTTRRHLVEQYLHSHVIPGVLVNYLRTGLLYLHLHKILKSFYILRKWFTDHVAARSKAKTVFGRSNGGIVESNHTQRHGCLCVRLFCVYVVLYVGSGVATG
jgi:hypothetical protein